MFAPKSDRGTILFLLYVDDITVTSDKSSLLLQLITRHGSEIAMKDLGPPHYFLGADFIPFKGGIFSSQFKYAWQLLIKNKNAQFQTNWHSTSFRSQSPYYWNFSNGCNHKQKCGRSTKIPHSYLFQVNTRSQLGLSVHGCNELKDIINLLKGFYGIPRVLYIMIFESLFSPSQTCPSSQMQTRQVAH